jgi:hypothetical protein
LDEKFLEAKTSFDFNLNSEDCKASFTKYKKRKNIIIDYRIISIFNHIIEIDFDKYY